VPIVKKLDVSYSQPKEASILLLGLGNPILKDDRVGIEVAHRVAEQVRKDNVEFLEASAGGLALLDAVCGYDKVILIDAIQTGGRVGKLHKFKANEFVRSLRLTSVHGVDFCTAMEMGRKLGMKVPMDIRIYAVEVSDPFTFSEEMSPEVERAVPGIVKEILGGEFD
jgi:hydrogenase maturation protease